MYLFSIKIKNLSIKIILCIAISLQTYYLCFNKKEINTYIINIYSHYENSNSKT